MLVGEIIQKIRTAITDQPDTIPTPTATFAVVSAVGSTLTPGTYFAIATWRNPYGETLPSTESAQLIVGGNQGIQISSPAFPGVIAVRCYLTLVNGASGSECQFTESATAPFVISANPTQAGSIPTRNSAYNPDSDGDSFSCATLYDWVNDALKLASQICGGLIDYCGVSSIVGNPTYIVPGEWRNISDVWYDGYPLAPDKVGNFFRRNSITASILSQVAMSILDNRLAIEVWPQPARTGGSTTLVSPITSTASSLTAANLGQFLLTNGMVMVDSEIMAYAPMTGNTLNNLIRGLGGSSAQAHAANAPIIELNLFFHGWRMYSPTYQPGQASLVIPVPVGWETLFHLYGLARARLAEQDTAQYGTLFKAYQDGLSTWYKTNHVVVGPKQVGEVSNNLEVIPTLGGGWVVP